MIVPRPLRASIPALAVALALAGCASVQQRAPIDINLVALNDFHGNLEPSKYTYTDAVTGKKESLRAGGIDTLGGALAAWRREDKDLLLVAAGDLIGASPAVSSMWADEPTISALNMLGLSVSSLGNHEFDGGRKELLRQQHGGCDSPRPSKACQLAPNFGGAKFGYLAANVTDSATGKLLVPAYRIESVKGVKVGFVGAVLQGTPSVAVASAVAGLSFHDEAESINKVIPEMRKQGAQVFVVLIHEGGKTDESPDKVGCERLEGAIVPIVQKLDPAIRLIITGHSHQGYLCNVDGRVVTQAASFGHLLSRIKMTVDPATGGVQGIDVRNVVMKEGDFAPDTRLTEYVASVKERSQAALARPVARLGAAPILRHQNEAGESPLGDVVADAVVAATRAQGVQIGFMNGTGIRKDLEAGADLVASFGQAQAVLPFGNTLVVMDLTGAQLHRLIEQQWDRPAASDPIVLQVSNGFSYAWDSSKPAGSRVVPGSVKLNGVPLEDAQTYRIAVNNFLAEGGDHFAEFAKGTKRIETKIYDLDALIDYLAKNPGVGAPNASLAPSVRIQKVR
ncbi:bifunctional metallophosphatase/5'-nucleotidase [Massilia horti]|uniref:Bifunctional metallophosphatase/5'-nucleotidase n=1 Tax=Massilia horti TaxID=2562153 RepID=A0A4Y9T5K7_9BURK|nr:bifunctional metallophosphatase/5'-nucleotidase [Massilia horti]TFW32456.1 bifunctional metallophosphatase/5'-nucleotidase [Massilia horti]